MFVLGIEMFREVFAKFKNKKGSEIRVGRDVLQAIYRILHSARLDLVEIFYIIKDRKLRDVYDNYAFMMIRMDKTIQFLRRILNEDLYAKYPKLTPQEMNEYLFKLPSEVSVSIRNLVQTIRLLKEFALSMHSHYINSVIKSISDILDSIAKYLNKNIE